MYDFYPEWGPSRNRGDDEATPVRRRRYWQPGTGRHRARVTGGAGAPDPQDAERQRPDDN